MFFHFICKNNENSKKLQAFRQKSGINQQKFFKSPHDYHLLGLFLLIPKVLGLLEEEFKPRTHPINAPPMDHGDF